MSCFAAACIGNKSAVELFVTAKLISAHPGIEHTDYRGHRVWIGLVRAHSVDESGQELSGDAVIRNTVEGGGLADAVGIDSFNIAEHYRRDMMDSTASIITATIADRANHPARNGRDRAEHGTLFRVYREFATLDAVERPGQLIAGACLADRESFPLFGYELTDYEELFEGEARPAHATAARPTRHLVGQIPLPPAHQPKYLSASPTGGGICPCVGWCR